MSLVEEKSKYERAWNLQRYRDYSPGEEDADKFDVIVGRQPEHTVITDYGCGTGRGGYALEKRFGYTVNLIDIAANCLDPEVKMAMGHKFIEGDLRLPLPYKMCDYGYCTDVMEHIPTEYVMLVIYNILQSSRRAFFSIATVEDQFGQLVGAPLHLTVRSHRWWSERMHDVAKVFDERDLVHSSIFYVESK